MPDPTTTVTPAARLAMARELARRAEEFELFAQSGLLLNRSVNRAIASAFADQAARWRSQAHREQQAAAGGTP